MQKKMFDDFVEELGEAWRILRLLYDLAEKFAANPTIGAVDSSLSLIAKGMRCADVFLLKLENGNLVLRYALKRKSLVGKMLKLQPGGGFLGRTGAAMATSIEAASDQLLSRIGHPIQSALSVPMIVNRHRKSRLIGVLVLIRTHGYPDFEMRDIPSGTAIAQLLSLVIESDDLFLSTIKALAEALDERDPYTRQHSQRIAQFAVDTANRLLTNLNWTGENVEDVRRAGILHDIGKIGIPESILQKPGNLIQDEYLLMQAHLQMSVKNTPAGSTT